MTETIFKKKFRWTFAPKFLGASMRETFVKITVVPNLKKEEESEIDFLSAKTWIPGKFWDTLVTTYFDLNDEDMKALGAVLQPFFFPEQPIPNPIWPDRLGSADLVMYDGCGSVIDRWVIEGLYPEEANFVDLDHSSTEQSDIEVTWKFSAYRYVMPDSR